VVPELKKNLQERPQRDHKLIKSGVSVRLRPLFCFGLFGSVFCTRSHKNATRILNARVSPFVGFILLLAHPTNTGDAGQQSTAHIVVFGGSSAAFKGLDCSRCLAEPQESISLNHPERNVASLTESRLY
jgi:hypothetical protein